MTNETTPSDWGDDAMKWAEAFCKTVKDQKWSLEDIDEDLMLGWFANAIEVSHTKRLHGMYGEIKKTTETGFKRIAAQELAGFFHDGPVRSTNSMLTCEQYAKLLLDEPFSQAALAAKIKALPTTHT